MLPLRKLIMNFFGQYYTNENMPCRKYLIITSEDIGTISSFDLLVIMMNPGSSRPISENSVSNICLGNFLPAAPDTTQSQIVSIMGRFNYTRAVVINLSDVVNPNSLSFLKNIHGLEYRGLGLVHSIMNRDDDINTLKKCLTDNTKVIIASGVNRKLKTLTQSAVGVFGKRAFGKKKNNKELFYHPWPRSGHKRNEWLKYVIKRIEKMLANNRCS
jgi:hypothetical protein